ncbi:MAG TPA: hypothetical protein PL045_00690 [Chitinophagaceae bacterium]|nr:hypothetical protein [Chitinophagaceae bacterium]
MKTLWYHTNKKIFLPENWDEITTAQYIRLVQLMHAGIDDIDMKADKALYILSGKSLYHFLRMPVGLRARCWEHVLWVFDTENFVTRQFIPSYKPVFGKRFYGPAGDLDNVVLAEFHVTETAFHAIVHDAANAADALHTLIAVLYREAKEKYDKQRNIDGDVRKPFTGGDIEWYKRKIKRWPLKIQQAILFWYAGCRSSLIELYDEAFDKTPAADSNLYAGLFSLIRGIAGGKYGDFEKVEKMFVHAAFMEMVACKREEAELKAKYPQLA